MCVVQGSFRALLLLEGPVSKALQASGLRFKVRLKCDSLRFRP